VVIERLVKRAKEQNRIDDTEEVIAKRLDVYKTETAPLISEFEKRGILEKIDGMASVEEVSEKIFSKLKLS
jgi:adenylate kinase